MTHKRSRLELYIDVLRVINNGVDKPIRIMYNTNLSWKPLNEIFESLLEQGLIEVRRVKNYKRYGITEKGLRVLGYFDKLQEEIMIDRSIEK